MKYLKLFNENKKITSSEFYSLKDIQIFDKIEIEKISDVVNKYKGELKIEISGQKSNIKILNNNSYFINIEKLNDDYYKIIDYKNDNHPAFYLCDQLNDVIKTIKSLILKQPNIIKFFNNDTFINNIFYLINNEYKSNIYLEDIKSHVWDCISLYKDYIKDDEKLNIYKNCKSITNYEINSLKRIKNVTIYIDNNQFQIFYKDKKITIEDKFFHQKLILTKTNNNYYIVYDPYKNNSYNFILELNSFKEAKEFINKSLNNIKSF